MTLVGGTSWLYRTESKIILNIQYIVSARVSLNVISFSFLLSLRSSTDLRQTNHLLAIFGGSTE